MAEYMACRNQLVEEYTYFALASGRTDYKVINNEAWSNAFKELWSKYHTCYYGCSSLMLNAFGEEAKEIYELVNEIRDGNAREYVIVVNTAIVPTNSPKDGEFIF